MANGIATWYLKNIDTGEYTDEKYLTREEAKAEAARLESISPYHSYKVSSAEFFLDGAPFHVSVHETLEPIPTPRDGDSLEIAERLDKIIAILFETDAMTDKQRDACYSALQSLHGSTYAGEWYQSTWYDIDKDCFRPTSRKVYTIAAFTRHDITVRADSPQDAINQVTENLYAKVFVTADIGNTVYSVIPEK